jgi:TPR repeat protein
VLFYDEDFMEENLCFAMVDLHGLSVIDAERIVNYYLTSSSRMRFRHIRFVTGRGNHVNNNGLRGTLYQSFLTWIENSAYKERIERCDQHDGYYEVRFKSTQQVTPLTDFFNKTSAQLLQSRAKEIQKLAEQGEPYFLLLYGKIVERGTGIQQNFKLAAQQYLAAAEKNYPPAMHELARCYLHGLGVRQSDKTAYEWLDKADKLDYVEATISMGDCYATGIGVKADGLKAVSYYAKALTAKHPLAMRKIASAYLSGIVKGKKEENEKKSFQWYKNSADLGDAISQYNTGSMLLNGTGTEVNEDMAIHYLKLSAEGGDPDGQFVYGHSLYFGNGITENKKEGLGWLEKASLNGSSQASNLLINIVDPVRRQIYIKRAAQSGSVQDKLWLRINEAGAENLREEEKDKLFDQSIRESYHLSINDIILLDPTSRFLIIDSLLKENKAKFSCKALEALERMANEKCIFSLRRLFQIYLRGFNTIRIKCDIPHAMVILHQAAELNDPKCQTLLANCYHKGTYVQKSLLIAANLYQRAIQQNYPAAFFYMAMLEMENHKAMSDPDILSRFVHYLETTITLEKDEKILNSFSSGIIDIYELVTTQAEEVLAGLQDIIGSHSSIVEEFVSQPMTSSPSSLPPSLVPVPDDQSEVDYAQTGWMSYCRLM